VGVGKSTTAGATARILRESAVAVACIDLDQVYCMIRQRDGFDDQGTWLLAREATAALAEHFFGSVASVVIVEGGFLTKAEQGELLEALKSEPRIEIITLHASFEAVYARVMADTDPGRVASKVPTFLKQVYVEYEAALPYLREATRFIDVENLDVEHVAMQVAEMLKCGN